MKNLRDILLERKDDTMVTLEPWADFLTINVEDGYIEYHKLEDIKNDENYFGEATKNVLALKPLQSFEDSVNVFVRLK
jgi:hypothetical protein